MSRHPQMYKMPRKPGYLGGYNWRASALGLLFLVVVSWIATQYIARRFELSTSSGHAGEADRFRESVSAVLMDVLGMAVLHFS
jgi:hypothetical protein